MVRYVRFGLVVSAVLAGFLASATKAQADSTSVAVLGVEPIEVPESLAQQLTDALRQRAAGTSGVRAVQGKDLIEIKMVFGCDQEQPACMAQAGKTLGADKLLYGTIKKSKSGATQAVVNLKLLDVKSGTVEHTINETIAKRDLTAGGSSVLASRWFPELMPVEAKPTLTVASDPPNATVTVDGNAVGRTPITLRDLPAGTHTVVVAAPGRVTQSKTVELRGGSTSELNLALEVQAVTPPPVVTHEPPKPVEPAVVPPPVVVAPQPQPVVGHPGRAAKFVALGALIGAVVAGSVAIYTWRSYDGLQSTTHSDLNDLVPPNQRCPTMGAPMTPEQQFACNPGPTVPASLAGSSTAQKYQNDYSSGQTYANATTALWVVTGALAGTAIITYIVGDRQAKNAEKEKRQSTTAKLLQQSLKVAPVFSSKSGGLTASFEF